MDKQKQIEEMAVVLTDGGCKTCVGCSHNNKFQCKPIYDAELLYNAGYRKQSEGEWEMSGLCNPQCTVCRGYNIEKSNFCPNCGAKMKGGESDEQY